MCTLYKLFLHKSEETECGGSVSTLGDLSFCDTKFLRKYNIPEEVSENATVVNIILNKLTPEKVELSKISKVDICETHLNKLAYNHNSLRQKQCPIEKCFKKGEVKRPRVSFQVATDIYNTTKQHVLVGTTLCTDHRKQFGHGVKVSSTKAGGDCVSESSLQPIGVGLGVPADCGADPAIEVIVVEDHHSKTLLKPTVDVQAERVTNPVTQAQSPTTCITSSTTGQSLSTKLARIRPLDIKTVDGAAVKVLENGTPEQFYCQLVSETLIVEKKEMDELLRNVTYEAIHHPSPGQGVLVRWGSSWCRATVLGCEGSSWKCELVDLGQVVEVLLVEMTKLPLNLVGVPAMSVSCTLAGMKESVFSDEASRNWQRIVHGQQFRMSVVNPTSANPGHKPPRQAPESPDDAAQCEEIQISPPNRKRKSFLQASETFPKLTKFDSETSSASSQNIHQASESSNYSCSSEIAMDRSLKNFNKLMTCLKEIDPSKSVNISHPYDLNVQKKTLKSYAQVVGRIWKIVLETVIQKTDQASVNLTNNFLKSVIETFDCGTNDDEDKIIPLALNILESIKEYYGMACCDSSRGTTATRKQLLQAVSGRSVRQAHQLSILSESIGARRHTVEKEAENRKLMEEKEEIVPYIEILKRKCPEGTRIVSDHEKFEVVTFYEKDCISDLLKGHNNILKETLVREDGSKFVFLRPKRVLKVHLCDLLEMAQKEIGFKYSLRTLMGLRPSWVLLAKEAHCLTCLCDRCANVQLILRSMSNFTRKIKQYGSPADKVALAGFDLTSSVSEFMSKILHPKKEGEMWHRPECYEQSCLSTQESPCGSEKMKIVLNPLIKRFGSTEIQLYQHLRVTYVKADGSSGSKMDQVESHQSLSSIVEVLDSRVFGKFHQQPYIQHRFKMLLGNKMRQDVHKNLGAEDVACYTDYSKELEITDQEQCKSSAFGASNVTIQLIGEVYEMKVLPPSKPTSLSFDQTKQNLSFSGPVYDGGSHIQGYEIHIKSLTSDSSTWQMLAKINVAKFSSQPEVPVQLFGRLGGTFLLRIFARSLVGLGPSSEITVNLIGDLPLLEQAEKEISRTHFELSHATFYVEYFFFSDHYDAPKNWRTILKCKEIALTDIKNRYNRSFARLISISDTGGENYGSTALCCYSFSETDFDMESVWAPTAAHHSGQLSDSSCGTLKRCIKSDLKCGKAKFLSSAARVVKYCQEQPVMREVSHSKYLKAKTVFRSYHHITKIMVESCRSTAGRAREVECLVGVSKLKQVWSVGREFNLLARMHTCCCSSCMLKDFENCDIKDYTDRPQMVSFTPVRPRPLPSLRRKVAEQSRTQLVDPGGVNETEEENDGIEEKSETCNLEIQIEKIYVILGNSSKGYYVVKSLAALEDTFSGKYLKQTIDLVPNKLVFKETKDTDIFYINSIVAELIVVQDVSKNITRFIANKVDMDDILMTVAEIGSM